MKEVDLLAAKTIKSVSPGKLAMSITHQGGGWRLRVAFLSEIFTFLYAPLGSALSPKGNLGGSAEEGVVVSLSKSTGYSVTSAKTSVSFSISARDIGATENKVPNATFDCFMVEFEDGARVLVSDRLPTQFMSSRTREKVTAGRVPRLKLFLAAYKRYFGQEHASAEPLVLAPPPVEPLIIPPVEPPVEPKVETKAPEPSAPITAPAPLAANAGDVREVRDLRELVEMINAEVEKMNSQPGHKTDLRIDDGGRLRARVQVVINTEI